MIFKQIKIGNDNFAYLIADESLKKSEEKYSTLVEKGNDAIIITQDGALKFANSKTIELTGFSFEEIIEKPFIDFIAPEYRDTVR